jgi:hypothetical protein
MSTKICNKCKKEYPATLEWFSSTRSKSNPDWHGWRNTCKPCINKEKKEKYISIKKEKIILTIKACTSCSKEYPNTLEYFYKEKLAIDGLRSKCKKCHNSQTLGSYYKNPELYKTLGKAWRSNNKDVSRKINRKHENKRRALKLGNGHEEYTEEQILELYGINCNICSLPIDLNATRRIGKPGWENGLHIDHVVPISKGGPDMLSNVRPTHGLCNIIKKDRT